MKKKIVIMIVFCLSIGLMLFAKNKQGNSYGIQDYPWELRKVESDLKQFEKISLKINKRTLSTSGVGYELTNSSDYEAVYGTDEYDLHVLIDESWYEIQVYEDEGLMASILASQITYENSKNWEQRYGDLTPGYYRLVIPITVEGTEYYMTDEFVIRK